MTPGIQQRLDRIQANVASKPALVVHDVECQKHGPQQWHQVFTNEQFDGRCPRCKADDQRREERIYAYLDEIDLPTRFHSMDMQLSKWPAKTAAQKAVLEACRAYVHEADEHGDGRGLILTGPPGTGKTMLLAGIAYAWIETHAEAARFVTQRDLIRRLRATWRKEATETEDQVIRDYTKVGLLALDDAGIGYGSEGEQVQLLDVIDARYRSTMPTVISTNLDPPALKAALGERCYDRLRENAKLVRCMWPSFRGLKLSTSVAEELR